MALDQAVADLTAAAPGETLESRTRSRFLRAHRPVTFEAMNAMSLEHPTWTATVVALEEGAAAYGHIGLSRLYRLGDYGLRQVTCDDSLGSKNPAHRLVESRLLGLEGWDGTLQTGILKLQPGEGLLICSPGVWDAVTESEMLTILHDDAEGSAGMCRRLVEAAPETREASAVLARAEATGG